MANANLSGVLYKRPLPNVEVLRYLLSYDPETGAFVWKNHAGYKIRAGHPAGFRNAKGHVLIQIRGVGYMAHRLAWKMVHGVDPTLVIDHINGIKDDNRISNLREVDHATNCQNRHRAQSTSVMGVMGVSNDRGRFTARLGLNGKMLHIGAFDTPEEAHQAYLEAKRRLHPGCTI